MTSKIALLTTAAFLFLQVTLTSGQLVPVLNPGCDNSQIPNCKSNTTAYNLVYVQTNTTNSSIHYLWSSIGSFSLLLAETTNPSNLIIDWQSLVNYTGQSITFSGSVLNYNILTITKIWEYNDPSDTADITKANPNQTITHYLDDVRWQPAQLENGSTQASATFISAFGTQSLGNATLNIKVTAFSTSGRATVSPKLLYISDSLQLEITLNNVAYKYSDSRFGLEMALVSSDGSQSRFTFQSSKTMDDEYTPGVFSSEEVVSDSSYLQWKPIAYTTSARSVEALTATKMYSINNINNVTGYLGQSLAYAFLGAKVDSSLSASMNVSFGEPLDDYYANTKYQIWTLSLGLGVPPSDSVSLTVLLVILIGLGLPVLVVFAGSGYLLYTKLFRRRTALTEFDEFQ